MRKGRLLGIAAIGLLLLTGLWLASAGSQAADVKAGKAIYDRNCASCHGRNGKGLGDSSPTPDFTNTAVTTLRTDDQLLDKIANGGKGTGMPAWKSRLSEKDRRDVLAYIRTFAR